MYQEIEWLMNSIQEHECFQRCWKQRLLPCHQKMTLHWGLDTFWIILSTWNLDFKARRSDANEGRMPWDIEGALLGLNSSLWFWAETHWQECNALAMFRIRMYSWLAFVKETALNNADVGIVPKITALKYQGWGPNIKIKRATKTTPIPYNWSLRKCLINRLCWSNSSSVSCRSMTTLSMDMGLRVVILSLFCPTDCLRTGFQDSWDHWSANSFKLFSTRFSLILKYVVDWAIIRWTQKYIIIE